jgi:hypothetical protein
VDVSFSTILYESFARSLPAVVLVTSRYDDQPVETCTFPSLCSTSLSMHTIAQVFACQRALSETTHCHPSALREPNFSIRILSASPGPNLSSHRSLPGSESPRGSASPAVCVMAEINYKNNGQPEEEKTEQLDQHAISFDWKTGKRWPIRFIPVCSQQIHFAWRPPVAPITSRKLS